MKKKLSVFNIFIVFVALLISVGAWADPAAQAIVVDTTKQIIEEIKKQRQEIDKNPAQLAKLVDKIVFSRFDFTKMSTWVLGNIFRKPSWKEEDASRLLIDSLNESKASKSFMDMSLV